MEWIDQLQQALGAPVVALARDYWVLLVVIGAGGLWWLLGGRLGQEGVEQEGLILGRGDRNEGFFDSSDD